MVTRHRLGSPITDQEEVGEDGNVDPRIGIRRLRPTQRISFDTRNDPDHETASLRYLMERLAHGSHHAAATTSQQVTSLSPKPGAHGSCPLGVIVARRSHHPDDRSASRLHHEGVTAFVVSEKEAAQCWANFVWLSSEARRLVGPRPAGSRRGVRQLSRRHRCHRTSRKAAAPRSRCHCRIRKGPDRRTSNRWLGPSPHARPASSADPSGSSLRACSPL